MENSSSDNIQHGSTKPMLAVRSFPLNDLK